MIERTLAFKTTDASTFSELHEAQEHEISLLHADLATVASMILEYSDKIVDILTTTPTSKPKARKIHGGTKTRKPRVSPRSDVQTGEGT
jgi:hypothetical protein